MRIQITGSREFTDFGQFKRALDFEIGEAYRLTPGSCVVVHGGARGADSMVQPAVFDLSWVEVEKHPADWERYGKSAGYRRNAEMVAKGADVCLAFFKRGAANRGTAMMVDLCKKAGIPVKEFWEE